MALQTLDDGRLLVNEAYIPVLRRSGLDTLAALLKYGEGKLERAVPGRSTVRVETKPEDGRSSVFFLKRYEPTYLSKWQFFLRAIHWPGADDEASREWRKIVRLQEGGFLTAEPVLVGQLRQSGVVTGSCVMTEKIAGGVPADDYFKQHLQGAPPQRKWRWLAEMGKFARRFQDAQFIHKDFYFSHIFVVEEGEGWKFFLIDLQRAHGPGWHLPRWYFKDAAGLTFSARFRANCSHPQMLRIYKAYAGVKKLGAADKRFVRKLWRRAQRTARHTPKYKRIWNQPPATTA